MTAEEKDFAHFSNDVYTAPAERRSETRGYTLLQYEIPRSDGTTVPLNDERWAVYRSPNLVDYVLVFRGTADWEDVGHDCELMARFGEHRYMMEAAVWSMRVMLFLSERHANSRLKGGKHLTFRVAGHSLGGAVAMGVMLLLHDIPRVTRQLQRDANEKNGLERLLDFSKIFKKEVADPWHDATSRRGECLYEFGGGHIFNPGAFPCLEDKYYDFLRENDIGVVEGFGIIAALVVLEGHCSDGDGGVDKLVTTHHVIGDVLSCSFRLGTEKSYLTSGSSGETDETLITKIRNWRPHSMNNFIG